MSNTETAVNPAQNKKHHRRRPCQNTAIPTVRRAAHPGKLFPGECTEIRISDPHRTGGQPEAASIAIL